MFVLKILLATDGADAAADLGRLRQHDDVITARRNLLRVRRLWYPIMLFGTPSFSIFIGS